MGIEVIAFEHARRPLQVIQGLAIVSYIIRVQPHIESDHHLQVDVPLGRAQGEGAPAIGK